MSDGIALQVGIVLSGLFAGISLCSALVEHAARTLNGANWVAFKNAKESVFGPVMPIFFGIVLVASIVVAVTSSYRNGFLVTSCLLFINLLITVLIHLPLNKLFLGWSAGDLPHGWDSARSRWRNWNWARCVFSTAAFCAAVLEIN